MTTLLDVCCKADGVQGGTIHQFLSRLSWVRLTGPAVARMGSVPVWSLRLDGVKELAWTQCYQNERPSIDPHMARPGNGMMWDRDLSR